MFSLRDLEVPLVQAPMAGGPSTPRLAAAVSNGGGLGSVAGGYLSAEAFHAVITETAGLTTIFNANVFVPEEIRSRRDDLERYARALSPLAACAGIDCPSVPAFSDDEYDAKIAVLRETKPAVASFTFGLPSADVLGSLNDVGIFTGVTVTSVHEAENAESNGAQFLILQGQRAGGHVSVHRQDAPLPHTELEGLLIEVRAAVSVPLVAGGGISTVRGAQMVLDSGAHAVLMGTRFLTCAEAGTKPVHRAALLSGQFHETHVTRAFTGRMARGLVNDFMTAMEGSTVVGYPEVHYMTSPIRKAAAEDPQLQNLWAGTGFAECRDQSAAELIEEFSSLRATF